ncbi:murein transglycosylase A [Sphingomonas sp.]|uniref:murein transglycosylase A n=1 Tax=Sphingomonas sp. TaxID=28214 RepID=UPI00286BC7E9|nr:murein transglycosylase A [Sphingomonas sp.]
MRASARAFTLAALLFVAGCVQRTPPVAVPPVKQVITTALQAGVALAEPQPLDETAATRALTAFRASCPVLATRVDGSGLTQASDWAGLCAEAASVAEGSAAAFFHDRFEWVRVGDGAAFATGYYEPEIAASRTRKPGFDTPIYGLPADLIRCTRVDGTEGRGRLDAAELCVPYFTRGEIEGGALANRGLEIGWAADPVALFFVEIQGSGQLRLADGSVMRIGYAGQNGQPYVAIGKLLRERGILPPGGANMQAIRDWIAAHPDEGKALMRENASYIFFRELTGAGPLGALNVPVTPNASVAADPAFIPLGAPVFLAMDRAEASGLWVAQDSGGAIKGVNRVDTFWGAGPDAEWIAGGMAAKGSASILLPKGMVARASARP